jgi:hypothetical protein
MNVQTALTLSALAATVLVAACGSAPAANDGTVNAQPVSSSNTQALPPPGLGTLRQDDFTVALQAGQVQVKATPLAEAVIRLAAPDTYQRLHRLVESRSDQIRQLAQRNGLRTDPLVVQVSFFTREIQAAFEPTGVVILSQGMLYRPVGILPITPNWGRMQLRQQQQESALYLFDPAIDLNVILQVEYGGTVSLGWGNIVPRLEAERARVLSRTRG